MARKKGETLKPAPVQSAQHVLDRLNDFLVKNPSSSLLGELYQTLVSSDGVEQVAAIKKIEQELQQCKDVVLQELTVEVLSNVVITASHGQHVKKAAFRVLGASFAAAAVLPQLSAALKDSLFMSDSDLGKISHNIENLLYCLSEPLGVRSVERCFSDVLFYLKSVLNLGIDTIGTCCGDTQVVGDCYQLLAKVVKAVGLLVQFATGQRKNYSLKPCAETLIAWTEEIFPPLLHLLKSDSSILTCKLSTGTVLPLVLRVRNDGQLQKAFDPWPKDWFRESPLAEICFLSGLVSGLSEEELLQTDEHNRTVLLHILLKRALIVHERSRDSGFLLTCVKSVLQLVNRIVQLLKSHNEYHVAFTRKLLCERHTATEPLLRFVWSYWEHYVDAVSQHARLIFRGIVDMNILLASSEQEARAFLEESAVFLIDLPWHRKGKYDTIAYLAEVMGCSALLRLRPALVTSLLSAAEEPTMCSYVKDLVQKLASLHRKEACTAEFERAWLEPFSSATKNHSRELLVPLFQHVLPVLTAIHPGTTQYVFGKLSEDRSDFVPATLKCLLLDKALIESGNLERWRHVLLQGMSHRDVQVRLDTLQLLTEHPKSCEPVKPLCLRLLRSFLHLNVNMQGAPFRQQMISCIKKVLNRIFDSSTLLNRQLRRGEVPEEQAQLIPSQLEAHQEFVTWLHGACMEQLFPGANFGRRFTALAVLEVLVAVHASKGESAQLSVQWSWEAVLTLMQCLKDPYEANKTSVLQVLLAVLPGMQGRPQDEGWIEELLLATVALTKSARPPDSVTAAYFLDLISTLNLTAKVSQKLCNSLIGLSPLLGTAKKLRKSPDEDEGVFWTTFLVLSELESQLKVAKKNLLEASSTGPLYGALISLRALLRKVNWKQLAKENVASWKAVLCQSMQVAFEVATVVGPVVSNASPEGQLDIAGDPGLLEQMQVALQKGLGRRFELAPEDGDGPAVDVVKSTAVVAQMLLLCGWRAHREVSLFFGEICETCPLEAGPANAGVCLSLKQVLSIGDFFMEQMSTVRHRGAFEQAYTAFQKLCHMLWRCKHPELAKLPSTWLGNIMAVIKEKGVCATRRSAGIPFMVQAILVSEPEVRALATFHRAIRELLVLATMDTEASVEPKVHAMNVLRALFREARLGDAVMPYAADGIQVAIIGFESKIWSVRNSATLLFSTLMTRIFGVNRSREETQRKNCLTGHVFFLRFPPLFRFLLQELSKSATYSRDLVLSSNAFPVLLLLARLFPSVVEGSFRLEDFVPHVARCARSPVWKVRALAARALVPLVAPSARRTLLLQLISTLPGAADQCVSHNAVHGTLLQVLQVIGYTRQSCMEPSFVALFSAKLEEKVWLASSANKCFVSRAAYLDVILSWLQCLSDPSQLGTLPYKLIAAVLLEDPSDQRHSGGLRKEPGQEFLITTRQDFLLELGLRWPDLFPGPDGYFGFVLRSLSSMSLEARWMTLQFVRRTSVVQLCSSCCLAAGNDIDRMAQQVLNRVIRTVCDGPGEHQQYMACFAEACSVLTACNGPHLEKLDWQGRSTFEDVLSYLLDWYENIKNEQTKRSLLELICSVAEQLVTLKNQDLWKHPIVLRWILQLLELSEPTEDLSRRLMASGAMSALAQVIVSAYQSGGTIVSFWWALVNFLQDDESGVRDGGVKAVTKLVTLLNEPGFPVNSLLEKTPLHLALCLFSCLCEPALAVPSLVSWMLASQMPALDAENDEQPFDKGELNTFAEEVFLTDICADLLSSATCELATTTVFASTDFFDVCFDEEEMGPIMLSIDDLYRYSIRNIHRDGSEAVGNWAALLLNRHIDPVLIRVYQNVRVAVALKNKVSREEFDGSSQVVLSVLTAFKASGSQTMFISKVVEQLRCLLEK
ncbi:tRNA (32-2'-O)-methyltransferase regulator THADA isoform X1 [Dermacentor andersoni]|uniref:tRNA (32-2'-O)-methyltransferase regulator THADA isoform X1 n=1 Tax=Dermacentor andersoni TaxID=34620 RepID=UPI002155C050|nr:thyroid adenoma-associated protein homolog isoform X1 [Dermacentor andersoni]